MIYHIYEVRGQEYHLILLFLNSTDMFLVGTAMLVFGVGLYAMFMGSKAVNDKGPRFTDSNLFGLFYMKVRTSQSFFLHMLTGIPSFSSNINSKSIV